MNNSIKPWAVFLDLDGTLFNSDGTIGEKTKKAIKAAQQKGHLFFVNTGRSTGNITPKMYAEISFLDGIVAGNGTYIKIGSKIISDLCFGKDVLKAVFAFFINKPQCWVVFEGRDSILGMNTVPLAWNEIKPVCHSSDFDSIYKDEAIQVVAVGGEVPKSFYTEFGDKMKIINMTHFYDCVYPQSNKAKAMKTVLGIINIPMERCMAIGDSENDLDMLRSAGFSVGMANAVEKVRCQVDYITDTNDCDGVGKAIQGLLSGEAEKISPALLCGG